MAGTEDITLRVVLDDRQAKAGLDALRDGTAGIAQAASAAAGADSGGGLAALSDEMAGLSQIGGASASALGRVSSSLGRISPRAGRAVNAIGGLAGALGAGGPLAIGILAAGQGISWLIGKYEDSAKAAEDSARRQQEAINNIVKAGLSPLESATLDLSKAQKELQLNRFMTGGESDQVLRAMTPIRLEMERLQTQIGASQRDLQKFRAESVRGIRTGESVEQYKEARALAEREAEAVATRIQLLQQAFRLRAEEINVVNESLTLEQRLTDTKKDKEKAERDHEKALQDSKRRMEEQLQVQEDYIRERRKIQEEAAAAVGPTREMFEQELNQRAVKARQDADKARTEAEKLEAEKRKQIADDEKKAKEDALKSTTANIMAATGIIVSASDQLLSDLITGQEKALERFAAAIFKQAGTVMLGKGLELGAAGVANLLSGNPVQMALAGGQLAGAAGLVAGGLALGAVATGIEHTVMGASGAAPTTATASSGSPTTSTPMGAGRISGSQREPGSMQEAITYVFNAPVFGDQNRSAKHVALLQRRAQRDLLLA